MVVVVEMLLLVVVLLLESTVPDALAALSLFCR
jgi:hypothetical protein